ncbi:odorant receptor 67c-like [Periplaneta americana]|uniref:odorant receptor 67c-like n=1 Tax=Periplaneta americana TaxID=6978 RepID=UPI0037E95736
MTGGISPRILFRAVSTSASSSSSLSDTRVRAGEGVRETAYYFRGSSRLLWGFRDGKQWANITLNRSSVTLTGLHIPNAINRDSEDVLIDGICLSKRLYQEEMQRYLACCVEQHQKIFKIVEELDAVLSFVMMMIILSSAALFAFLGMRLASATDSAVIIMSVTALTFCVMETGLICWIANNLTTQSEMVGEAAYNCGWYDASKKFNTSISLIIMRAQRPAQMSVGPFGTLSLELFGKIMNSAYSYFTLLKNANGK